MMNIEVGITGAKRQSFRAPSPRELLRKLIEAHPAAPGSMLLRKFSEAVRDDDEYLMVVIEYWFANNLRSLLSKPRDDTTKKVEEANVVAEVRAKLQKRIEEKARIILLDMVLPNGKVLRECTGEECAKTGGWLGKIATKIKPSQKVGKNLTEAQLQELYAE